MWAGSTFRFQAIVLSAQLLLSARPPRIFVCVGASKGCGAGGGCVHSGICDACAGSLVSLGCLWRVASSPRTPLEILASLLVSSLTYLDLSLRLAELRPLCSLANGITSLADSAPYLMSLACSGSEAVGFLN